MILLCSFDRNWFPNCHKKLKTPTFLYKKSFHTCIRQKVTKAYIIIRELPYYKLTKWPIVLNFKCWSELWNGSICRKQKKKNHAHNKMTTWRLIEKWRFYVCLIWLCVMCIMYIVYIVCIWCSSGSINEYSQGFFKYTYKKKTKLIINNNMKH